MEKDYIDSRKTSYLFVEFWLWFGIVAVSSLYGVVSYLDRMDDTNVGITFAVVSYLFRGLVSIALLIKVIKMREFKKTVRFSIYLGLLVVVLYVFFFPFQMLYD